MTFVEKIFAILAPHECLGCEREDEVLCFDCRTLSHEPVPSRCYRCHQLTFDNQTCQKCQKYTPLRHVWVAANYNGLLKQLLKAYKFERLKAARQPLIDYIDEIAPFFDPATIITHVPTATSRVRQRGYDQAELLARSFADKRRLDFRRLLDRLGQARQVGSTRAQRLEQLKGAFGVKNQADVANASIILIDDVITTGATLETAARLLKQAGAKSVTGLVVAQKQ